MSKPIRRVVLGTGYLWDDFDFSEVMLTNDEKGIERRRMRKDMMSALGKKVRLVAEVLP